MKPPIHTSDMVHRFLAMALDEALAAKREGSQPAGAVIASASGDLLSRGHNHVLATGDITAHAEIDALRQAGFAIHRGPPDGSWIMYVSAEPCFMCLGGIIMSPIETIVFPLDSPVGSPVDIVRHSGYLPARMARLAVVREPDIEIRERSRELLIEYYLVHDPDRARLLRNTKPPQDHP